MKFLKRLWNNTIGESFDRAWHGFRDALVDPNYCSDKYHEKVDQRSGWSQFFGLPGALFGSIFGGVWGFLWTNGFSVLCVGLSFYDIFVPRHLKREDNYIEYEGAGRSKVSLVLSTPGVIVGLVLGFIAGFFRTNIYSLYRGFLLSVDFFVSLDVDDMTDGAKKDNRHFLAKGVSFLGAIVGFALGTVWGVLHTHYISFRRAFSGMCNLFVNGGEARYEHGYQLKDPRYKVSRFFATGGTLLGWTLGAVYSFLYENLRSFREAMGAAINIGLWDGQFRAFSQHPKRGTRQKALGVLGYVVGAGVGLGTAIVIQTVRKTTQLVSGVLSGVFSIVSGILGGLGRLVGHAVASVGDMLFTTMTQKSVMPPKQPDHTRLNQLKAALDWSGRLRPVKSLGQPRSTFDLVVGTLRKAVTWWDETPTEHTLRVASTIIDPETVKKECQAYYRTCGFFSEKYRAAGIKTVEQVTKLFATKDQAVVPKDLYNEPNQCTAVSSSTLFFGARSRKINQIIKSYDSQQKAAADSAEGMQPTA